jgi:Fanconi-associated nuclease 1
MATIFSSCEGDVEADKKKWKRVALQTCESGLEDHDCHLIYHYDLQKRITKLERALKVVKREQHDFSHVLLSKATERVVRGVQILKDRSAERKRGNESLGSLGAQTVWLDEREGGGECRVEAMCLSWYRDQGWKGYHSEGGIVRTLVCLKFCFTMA